MKKSKLEEKKYFASKAILIEEKWGKLLKFDPECVKPVILFPFHSKTESCEITKVYISEFYIK